MKGRAIRMKCNEGTLRICNERGIDDQSNGEARFSYTGLEPRGRAYVYTLLLEYVHLPFGSS